MRLQLALFISLALTACGSTDPGPNKGDGGPNDTSVTDTGMPDDGPHSAHDDVAVADVSPAEVGADASPEAAVDAVAVVDVVADVLADTSSAEVGADVAPDSMCGGPPLAECVVEGVPMCVNIRVGRPGPGGTIIHCGMCGNTCAAGQVCSELRCQTP